MSDHSKLKALALEVPEGIVAPAAYDDDRSYSQSEVKLLNFLEAATPAAILALIAENERLTADLDCPFRLARHSKRLVEQLRSQAEQYDQALIKMAAERDQLKAELEIQKDYGKDQRWQFDQKSADLQKADTQIYQLKAENERLESEAVYSAAGFDAAREEVARLKAETGELRNGLRLARHWCASALKAARVDSQPSELLDIACLLRHQASDIDAAMGKGEQS